MTLLSAAVVVVCYCGLLWCSSCNAAAGGGENCGNSVVVGSLPFVEVANLTDSYYARFYSYVGPMNGTQRVVASLCNDATQFDTGLNLYTSCVSNSPDNEIAWNNDFCGKRSSLSWTTSPGVTYYFKVWIRTETSAEFYQYQLNFQQSTVSTHEICQDAMPIARIPFSDVGVTSYCADSWDSCDIQNWGSGGKWYSVVGTGGVLQVQTCTDNSTLNNLDTVIEVYESCSSYCIAENDDSCLPQAELVWATTKGVVYYIKVTTSDLNSGYFALSMNHVVCESNNNCGVAKAISRLPYEAQSSTVNVPDTYLSCQNENRQTLWWTVQGTGQPLFATTCLGDANYYIETIIDVYTGCSGGVADTCLVYNYDYCYYAAYVQWESVKGETYYIAVHGWIDESDGVDIHLLVDLVSNSDNDACYDAMLVPSFPWNVTQKISASDQISQGGCTDPLQRIGRWYYFTSDAPVQVSVDSCNSGTSESTTIEVYADTYNPCYMSLCETYSDTNYCSGKGQVAWMALAGIPYFIFVTPTKKLSLGSMTASLDFETFDNSQCVSAYQVPAGLSSWSMRSYTTYSSASFSSCTQQYSPALWYAIQGTGGTISASTCTSQTVFDTILSVFSSCNGTVESCVAYNDNGKYCGGTSLVTWTSYKGTEYFLQVAGMNGAKGMFEVTLSM